MASEIKEYNSDIERLFVQFFLSDPELFVRCMGIIDSKHFSTPEIANTVTFIKDYSQKHSALPSMDIISSVVGTKYDLMSGIGEAEKDWFLQEYESFARHKALENAILASPDLLMQHRYGEVESIIKDAVSIGLVKDLGTNYFKNPLTRLEAVANGKGAISTGWKDIDDKLYGGLNYGELTIWAGGSGAGKSLFLQNMAVNFVQSGLNVVYLSLELSEILCSMRIDAMIADMGTRDVMKHREDVALRVATFGKQHKGTLQIKQLKNGCTANDIRAYIKEYEIQSGLKVNVILLDYLDLCMPTNIKISPENLFIKDKYVSENLRDLAVELNVALITASQLNRGAVQETEFDHSHISGGLSKIQTADNVIGIYTTPTMRENGRYQIQFLKTRSSSGVGSRVDLKFSPVSLRISDLDPGEDSSIHVQTKAILENIKTQSSKEAIVQETEKMVDEQPKPVVAKPKNIDSAEKLRDIIKRME